MKYVYPAILTPDDGQYSVRFPDVEGALTHGNILTEAVEMAEDALSLMLVHLEDEKKPLPKSSNPNDLKKGKDDIVTLIHADTDEYRRQVSNQAVKKTLTIPSWLNYSAEAANINFSQVLQEALKQKLGVG